MRKEQFALQSSGVAAETAAGVLVDNLMLLPCRIEFPLND